MTTLTVAGVTYHGRVTVEQDRGTGLTSWTVNAASVPVATALEWMNTPVTVVWAGQTGQAVGYGILWLDGSGRCEATLMGESPLTPAAPA